MAIPINFYERQQPNVLGAVTLGLQQRLAREQMMIADRRAKENQRLEEQNRQRQHEQQMAQYGLTEMKFAYQQAQDQPGGLNYAATMSNINRDAASIAAQEEARMLAEERRTNPEKFWRPTAASRPKVIPLTAVQNKANADAVAMGMPPPHAVTVIQPAGYEPSGASGYTPSAGPGYTDPGYDLPSTTSGPGADPLIMEPIPAGTYDPADAGGGADLLAPPVVPVDNTPVAGAPPSYATPAPAFTAAPPVGAQGQLPMDPLSIARRQKMEDDRMKSENSIMNGLLSRKAKAEAALEDGEPDPAAEIELETVNRAIQKLNAPTPRAEVLTDAPRIEQDPNSRAGQTLSLNRATGNLEADVPAAQAEPAPVGIGLLPKSATDEEANKFWNAGKAEAYRAANLKEATNEELEALAQGGTRNSLVEYITGPAYDPAEGIAERIKANFQMPPGADRKEATGRTGEVAISEFVQAAAQQELNRRKVVQPKTQGVTIRKTKSPAAPNG